MEQTAGIRPGFKLFLSHTWNYNDAYAELNSLLGDTEDFDYTTAFVSPEHPVQKTDNERKLYETIKSKMKFCDAVILLCGVYSKYSRWVNKELIACKDELDKPLIAVQRFDAKRTSIIVKDNADVIVGWSKEEIVDAIKRLALAVD